MIEANRCRAKTVENEILAALRAGVSIGEIRDVLTGNLPGRVDNPLDLLFSNRAPKLHSLTATRPLEHEPDREEGA